jgi:membrane protease YdiL (CAAX protease family)
LGILFLLAAYPLVNLGFLVNEAIPLPSWAMNFEDQAEDTLKAILDMKTPILLIANLIIIAVLPGIGEELIFRGILQKQVGLMLKNPIAAIWIAGFIFSAIHLQFEGFLPRMALGVVLGYLYYWTQNLWVPIIAHAFNNGIQVIVIYYTGIDATALDEESSNQLQWWMIPLSVVVMYFIYSTIIKSRKDIEQV